MNQQRMKKNPEPTKKRKLVKKEGKKKKSVMVLGGQEMMEYKLGREVEGIELAAQKSAGEVEVLSLFAVTVVVMNLFFE